MPQGFIGQQEPKKQLPGTMSTQQMLDTFLEGMGMGFLGGVDPIGAVAGKAAEEAGAPPLAALIGSIGIPDPSDVVKLGKAGYKVIQKGPRYFLQGPTGQKAVAHAGDEFLDLISVGAKEGAGETFGAFDELAEMLGLQGRRGVTNLSQAGQDSIEKAVDLGFSTPNPAGSGFLQTGQDQGLEALISSLVSKIAPGYREGGQVDANAVLQFLLQGLK